MFHNIAARYDGPNAHVPNEWMVDFVLNRKASAGFQISSYASILTLLPFQPLSFEDAASGNAIYTPALADNCTFVIEAGEAGTSEVAADDDHILIYFYNSSCEVAQETLPKAYASNLTDDKVIALVVTWGLGSLVVVLLWGRREYGKAPEQQDIRRLNTINRLGLTPKGPCATVCHRVPPCARDIVHTPQK